MKQFLNRGNDCFAYLCEKFPALGTDNLRARIFDGAQIRHLMQDKYFPLTMTTLKKCLAVLYSSFQKLPQKFKSS